jgi:hypothetical protein
VNTHWEIEITATAQRELNQLSDDTYDELLAEILSLEEDPFPLGHLLLRGTRDFYRIKAGARSIPHHCHGLGGLKPSPLGDGFSTRAGY